MTRLWGLSSCLTTNALTMHAPCFCLLHRVSPKKPSACRRAPTPSCRSQTPRCCAVPSSGSGCTYSPRWVALSHALCLAWHAVACCVAPAAALCLPAAAPVPVPAHVVAHCCGCVDGTGHCQLLPLCGRAKRPCRRRHSGSCKLAAAPARPPFTVFLRPSVPFLPCSASPLRPRMPPPAGGGSHIYTERFGSAQPAGRCCMFCGWRFLVGRHPLGASLMAV